MHTSKIIYVKTAADTESSSLMFLLNHSKCQNDVYIHASIHVNFHVLTTDQVFLNSFHMKYMWL